MSQLPSHPGADGPRSGEARSCNRERAGSEFPGVHAVPPARVRGSSDVQNSCPPGLRASYGHAGGTPAHPARTWLNHVAFRYRRVPLAPRSPLASRFSLLASRLSPLTSRLIPSRLSPRSSLASCLIPSRLIPSPLSPLPVRAQRRCAPPRCRPTCNVQRATFNPSRLIPFATVPAAGPGATPLRPSTLSSHVQRATFNLQPLSPLASCLRAWCVIVLRSLQWIRNRHPPGSQFGDNRCDQGVEVRQHRFRKVQPRFQDQRFHSPQDNARRRLPA